MRKRKRTPCGRALAVLVLTGIVVQLIHMPEVSAYLADRNEKNNVLQVGDNTSTIEEKFDPPDTVTPDTTYNKTVSVRNQTDTPCYVRVFVEKDQSEIPLSIAFDTKHWTEKQADGYYYYRTVLEGKKKTEPLFTSVTTGKTEETFQILIYEETVQAQGFQTPQEAFASIRGEQESGV